jgi:ATP-dependent DNA helicase PIF1
MKKRKANLKHKTEFKQTEAWKSMNKGQREFFEFFFAGFNIFLTGAAGTGKSYVIKKIFEFLDQKHVFYGKTATTGVAALNIGGSTLHSWSGMGLADDDGMALLTKVNNNQKAVNRIKGTRILFVDEISMADSNLLDKLDIVCQYVRNSDQPFGGIQVVLVGDFLQLPPVFKNFQKELFAFDSEAWKSAKIQTVHLTEIVRQHDQPKFAEYLNEVRFGVAGDHSILKPCINRVFPNDGIKPVRLFCKNIDVDTFNGTELAKINAQEKVYYAIDEGGEKWTTFFNKNCLAPQVLRLRIGAQVMLLSNVDVNNGLVNGSVGIVESFSPEGPVVRFTTCEHVVEPHEWEIKQDEPLITGEIKRVKVASRKQLPLKLAWAVTVHKSQGATLDRAEIDISEAFAAGQVYVALSRVRTLESLSIKAFSPYKIMANQRCVKFYFEQEAEKERVDEFFEEESV